MEPEQRGKESDLHPRARDLARQHVAPTAARRHREAAWGAAELTALAELWTLAEGADAAGLSAIFGGLGEGGLDPGFAGAAAAHVHAGRVLRRAGGADAAGGGLRALVAGEWAHGFTPATLPIRATPRGDAWSLEGTAPLVSNAPAADVFVIVAGTPEGAAIFALDRRSVVTSASTPAALRTGPIGSVTLAGVSGSPAARLDGEESRRFLADIQNTERLLSIAPWHGALRAIHAMATDRLKRDAEARAMQQHRIALADLEIAALLCRAATQGALGVTSGEVSAALASAKLIVTERAEEALRLAVPIFGEEGLSEGHPVLRLAADAAALRVRVGGDGATRSIVASAFLSGRPPARFPASSATLAFAERFGAFCRDHVQPRAAEVDATGKIPDDLWSKVAESGYLRFFHPKEIGGIELEPESVGAAMELLSGACPSTAWKATISSNICARVFARHGTPEHRGRWLAPLLAGTKLACIGIVESIGSDFGSCRTTATRANGRWTVRGEKATVTNGPAADVCLLFTRMEGGDAEAGLVVIDMRSPGVSTEAYDLAGVRGMPWGPIRLADVRFEASDVLFSGSLETVTGMTLAFIEWGLLFQCACSIGLADATLRSALAFQEGRPAYGGEMLHLAHVHGRLAEMRAQIDAARLLAWEALRLKSRGGEAGHLCRLAKIHTSEMAVRVAVESVRLHGSAGIRPSWPAARILRDTLPNFYGGQSSDVLRDMAVAPKVGANAFATPSIAWIAERGFGPAR